jgi:parallel beta-helix repeat protein
MKKLRSIYLAIFCVAILVLASVPTVVNAAPPPPVPPNGWTAKIVATSGQVITGEVDATNYDIGIYIGPGIKNVKVTGATIHGARYEGILVQDTSDINITGNLVENNGDPDAYAGVIHEGKAIELAGTSDCIVKNNTVQNNNGDGGIGLSDYGPVFPALPFFGAPNNGPETVPVASRGNIITGNTVSNNLGGCGIVISAWNPGAGIVGNTVLNNTLNGGVGGIIVAADLPDTIAQNNVVLKNTVNDCFIMGIIVHSNAPGDVVSGTQIIGNTLSNDGFEEPPFDPTTPTGIAVVAEVPGPGGAVLKDTLILSNTVSNEDFGVWVYNAVNTHIAHNNIDPDTVATPISIQP